MIGRTLLAATGMLALIGLCAPTAALADCGPGPLVMQNNKGMILQSLGATTNATFLPTQAFAITTGTSGCSNSGIVFDDRAAEMFVAFNHDVVEQDIAAGTGPYLASLATLLGCTPQARPHFARAAQARFAELSASPETQAVRWLAELRAGLSRDAAVVAGCSAVS